MNFGLVVIRKYLRGLLCLDRCKHLASTIHFFPFLNLPMIFLVTTKRLELVCSACQWRYFLRFCGFCLDFVHFCGFWDPSHTLSFTLVKTKPSGEMSGKKLCERESPVIGSVFPVNVIFYHIAVFCCFLLFPGGKWSKSHHDENFILHRVVMLAC